MKRKFFTKFDWAAFWVATLVSFGVYFYTLGPSVGLEDSGELATASAHLGVPHPPGYPFWTFCTWIFCKIFSFVTYMGHPNPAWAVSCCSAVFGALAAGCTAMLISRSSADFIFNRKSDSLFSDKDSRSADWFSFAGGVGGALAFAFSPVEWSQSTIVEIYSLNSLFLMLVFLLSYKWMCRPSDKTLWFTAFVFGLGLTNYQVLLFAIVPIGIMICLKNFSLFRDFVLYFFPVALTYQVLKIGEMPQANRYMQSDVINKHDALKAVDSCPSTVIIVSAIICAVVALLFGVYMIKKSRISDESPKCGSSGRMSFYVFSALSLILLFLAGIGFLSSDVSWVVDKIDFMTGEKGAADITAPLVNPRIYLFAAFFVIASVFSSVFAVVKRDEKPVLYHVFLAVSACCVFMALQVVFFSVDFADANGYAGEAFDWRSSKFYFYAVIVAFLAVSHLVKNGLAYFIPVAGFHIVLFSLLERGAINGLTHPSSWWFWWPVAWNFIVLALAWAVLPNGRTVALSAFFTQLGVSFYAYMPIVSELRNPPMNWGYPRTWDGFKHAITRGQYEAITMPEFGSFKEFWAQIKIQMTHYFSEVKIQFTDFIALLALLPLSCWKVVLRRSGGRMSFNVLWVCAVLAALLAVRAVLLMCGIGTSPGMLAFDRWLIAVMAIPAVIGVLIIVFRQLVMRPATAFYRFLKVQIREKRFLVLAVCGVLLLDAFAVSLHASMAAHSAKVFFLLLLMISVFAAVVSLVPFMLRKRFSKSSSWAALSFQSANLSQHWLLASGACFFMMTLPLILLAQVKGDIQDGFIQKVKFISSHAMIAMWIGYGLVILAAVVFILHKRSGVKGFLLKTVVAILVLAMILGAGVTPVVQNYTDDELVFKLGGSEQNGHTFGWQFGAYQLDGAGAIRSQITADEEPLPDPDYPPPMEPYSIFFGGTDPGRFVPTYMIYGANFRPDVYLITQNALADGTYMAVERDLYGDEIWIPSEEDSAIAFQRYADRKGLSSTNGRLQVTGALEVMEINAELAKMMHEHDRKYHAFYIEESYAMPWMYPYLSPHGLIMKINADKTAYDPSLARRDGDFWDWYMRRLINDPMYRRDFAAQKSFSKLRASIAGLYRQQYQYHEAAQAFREAHLLYPASPEATFRYVSEILFPEQRLDVIGELMSYTDDLDPNNVRTDRIKKYLYNVEVVKEIEARFRSGSQSFDDAFTLAESYFLLGRREDAVKMMSQLVNYVLDKKDESKLHLAITVMLSAGNIDVSWRLLEAYSSLSSKPDPRLFLEWSVLAHHRGSQYHAAAYKYFDYAASRDPQTAAALISQYVNSLPRKSQDCRLWLKLAKCQNAAKQRENAIQSLYTAYTLNPNVSRMECQRDAVLKSIMDDLIKISEQQRR